MKHSPLLQSLIDVTLLEDYAMGDLTAEALIPEDVTGVLELVAKENMMVCGSVVLDALAQRFGMSAANAHWTYVDGSRCSAGDVIVQYSGQTRALLAFERPALNFLQRLSGIATLTASYVERIAHTQSRLLDTRKTLPGHRLVEKYATRIGGAVNHRSGLDRGWLIKENHIRQVGSVHKAIHAAKAYGAHGLMIEIEVENFQELEEAVVCGADIVLLDNFSVQDVRQAVQRFGEHVTLEASGGITAESVVDYAETGVELIAVGALTHSARSLDIGGNLLPDIPI
jgi:nicotinate-nucleotide pyrophosphorylase (carboxylating)